MLLLLSTIISDSTLQQPISTSKISLLNLLEQGGFIMYPLYLLLIIVIFVFIERFLVIKNENIHVDSEMLQIKDKILSGQQQAAIDIARKMNSAIGRIIEKGIIRMNKPVYIVEKSMENIGRIELFRLEKGLQVLSLIAGIAPMFGFLGTIVGMVQLFYGISSTGEYTLNTIAGGIYTKMITSATGLIIGLLAYIAHHFLTHQIDKKTNQMEIASIELLDIIQTPTNI